MSDTRKYPNFFIVGAPRCGTTSMYEYLREHPQIFMPNVKEPHYFGKDLTRIGNAYKWTESEYLNLFKEVKNEIAIGEASPHYLFSELSAEEIYRFNPDSKIIIMLRNPVDMIYSLHSRYVFSGNEIEIDFEKALDIEDNRIVGKRISHNIDLAEKLLYKSYVKRLPLNIIKYINIFGENNVKIIIFEDFKNNVKLQYLETLQFLGADNSFVPNFDIKNMNKIPKNFRIRNSIRIFGQKMESIRKLILPKPFGIIRYLNSINTKFTSRKQMNSDLRKRLTGEFEPIVKELEILLKRDLSEWREAS